MAMHQVERLSPCKINLLLNILGRREDGFHELETLFFPVPLHDRLSFTLLSEPALRFTCTHPGLPTGEENLVVRAAKAFFSSTAIPPRVAIHLEKNLPLAAGLGAGSANAATTLLALNDLFGRLLGEGPLHALAATLGSDVPFFLQSRPALAFGRGEKLESLPELPALRGKYLVLVHPGFGVSTAWAYRALTGFPEALHGRPGRARELAGLLATRTLAEAADKFYNALEKPVLRKYPLLALYQDFFRSHGAEVTLMSGSGSSTFALMESPAAAERTLQAFHRHFAAPCWTAVVAL